MMIGRVYKISLSGRFRSTMIITRRLCWAIFNNNIYLTSMALKIIFIRQIRSSDEAGRDAASHGQYDGVLITIQYFTKFISFVLHQAFFRRSRYASQLAGWLKILFLWNQKIPEKILTMTRKRNFDFPLNFHEMVFCHFSVNAAIYNTGNAKHFDVINVLFIDCGSWPPAQFYDGKIYAIRSPLNKRLIAFW